MSASSYWYLLGGIVLVTVVLAELLASPVRSCPRCERARQRRQEGCCCGHSP